MRFIAPKRFAGAARKYIERNGSIFRPRHLPMLEIPQGRAIDWTKRSRDRTRFDFLVRFEMANRLFQSQ